jgi:hypothetical protein
LREFILSLDGLGTLFSNLVGRTWGLNLKVDLSRLHVFVLNHSLKTLLDTLVSNRFGVLISFFFGLEDEVNLAFLTNGVIGFFLFNYWFSLGNGSRFDWLWGRRSSWSGSLLGLLGKGCDRGGSFGFCGLLGGGLGLGLLGLGVLVSLLLVLLLGCGLSLLLLFGSSLLFLIGLLFFLLLMGLLGFDLGWGGFALLSLCALLGDLCLDLRDLLLAVILSLLLNSFFLLLFLGFFLDLGR